MVKGKGNPIYRNLVEKYYVLRARDEGVPRLNKAIFNEINMPVVFVEGKTDVSILTTAWKKLFNGIPPQFKILKADIRPETQGGGAGADNLSLLLNAHRSDDPYIAIGLFDRDRKGKSEYQNRLHNDFRSDPDGKWKIAKERKAGAMVLPVPPGKEDYDSYDNLCIEFYFSEQVLSTSNADGIGLTWEYPNVEVQGKRLPDEFQLQIPATRILKGGKVIFAEQIVPTLEIEEFEVFRPLFDNLVDLINQIQDGN
jgi:hypothetical protein